MKVLAEDERIVWGARNNIALRVACQNAHPQSVELILKQRGVDASPDDDYCLRISVEKGREKTQIKSKVTKTLSQNKDNQERKEKMKK